MVERLWNKPRDLSKQKLSKSLRFQKIKKEIGENKVYAVHDSECEEQTLPS
jgi:hypothetical protein